MVKSLEGVFYSKINGRNLKMLFDGNIKTIPKPGKVYLWMAKVLKGLRGSDFPVNGMGVFVLINQLSDLLYQHIDIKRLGNEGIKTKIAQ